MTTAETDTRIGVTFVVPPSKHAGHLVTVTHRDPVEKHNAYWVRCECGAATTVGVGELGRLIDGRDEFPWDTRFVEARRGKVVRP